MPYLPLGLLSGTLPRQPLSLNGRSAPEHSPYPEFSIDCTFFSFLPPRHGLLLYLVLLAIFLCLPRKCLLPGEGFGRQWPGLPRPPLQGGQNAAPVAVCRGPIHIPPPAPSPAHWPPLWSVALSTDLNYGPCHVQLSSSCKCLSCSPDSEPLEGRGCLDYLCDPKLPQGRCRGTVG